MKTMPTNILLVEDDASLNTVLADYLRSKDYTVETAQNGKEAWELIIIKHYDLIITDDNISEDFVDQMKELGIKQENQK